jgi:dTDP-glucose 4,6-dehydratase
MGKKKKVLVTGSGGFIFGNFIRQVFYDKKPYTVSSIDRVRDSHLIHNIYVNMDHQFYIADVRDSHTLHVIFQKERPDVVVHGAAESCVDKSIEQTAPFTTSNVVGTQNVIDECLKINSKFIYMSCYDDKTKAVTKDGLKSYSEIKAGDVVLSINPQTGVVEEKEVEKVIVQDYSGDMVRFQSSRVDLLTTPNHRFLVSENKKLKWKTAEELEENTLKLYFPTGTVSCDENVTVVDIPGIGIVDADSLFYLSGVFIGDGFTGYQEKKIGNKSGYNRNEFVQKSKSKTNGRFTKISGGPNDYSVCKSHRIWFDVPENDKARDSLEKALTALGIEYKSHRNKSGEHIYFTSEKWLKYFEQFGSGAKNKHIPNWMFEHKQFLMSLWRGIHDSDGHGFGIPGRNVNVTTTSNTLVTNLIYLGQMLGFNTRYEKRNRKSYLKGRKIEGEAYIVHFSSKRNILIPKTSRELYSSKIWCLKVKDNKNFLVERNGKTFFCGNTDEVYGALKSDSEPSWDEDAPLKPRNPYSATKAAGELLVRAAHETHGLRFNIVRACNNYGPWQTPDKFIPRIIQCILNDKPIPIYGKGDQIRDWIHVYDTCEALFKVIDEAPESMTYNITAKQEFTNLEVAQAVCNAMEKGHDLLTHVEDRPGHDFRYSITNDRIKALGWKPTLKFREGIRQTCQWYVTNKYALQL